MRFDSSKLTVGVDLSILSQGVKVPVTVDFSSVPHMLIVAPSGSGKTYLLTYILVQIAKKSVKLILGDFKGIDFIEFNDCRNYYKHNSVGEAVDCVFDELQNRMANASVNSEYEPIYLCIDEWSGFLSSLAVKKEQDNYKQKLANILMLGRGANIFIIMSLQRADSTYITGRDNFGNVVGLGTLSKESIAMVFNDNKEMIEPKSRGKGYLQTDGKPLREIVVPMLRNINDTKAVIKTALSR
ncbi:MAG: type IV secretory system conjugative DNA transfer family protein [Ruminococcus sp.]|jgi:DNA segregation ATPase ftsK/spoIIIE and related proteins|uniref:type IV secretory system conjugative DNA transfer family protein n=1 Tax=Ruminococcus intestinalis TaxID=2763066 RepID=UPI003A225F59